MRLLASILLTAPLAVPSAAQVDEMPQTPREARAAFARLHLEWGSVPDKGLVRSAARRTVAHDPSAAFAVEFVVSALATLAPLRVPSGHETDATRFDAGIAQLVGALEMHQALSRAFAVQPRRPAALDALLEGPLTRQASAVDTSELRAFAGDAWASPAYLRACGRWLGHVRERAACVRADSPLHARAVELSEAARELLVVLHAGLALVDPPTLGVPPDALDELTETDALVRKLLADGGAAALARVDALAHSAVRAEQVAGTRGLLHLGYLALARGDSETAARHGLNAYLSSVPHGLRYRALVLYCLSAPTDEVLGRLEIVAGGAQDAFVVPHLAELRTLARLR